MLTSIFDQFNDFRDGTLAKGLSGAYLYQPAQVNASRYNLVAYLYLKR